MPRDPDLPQVSDATLSFFAAGALVVFVVSLVLMAATPYFGAEIKGARRWLVILGVNVQPSEFLKPAFVILIAWLFGESAMLIATGSPLPMLQGTIR